ncbi:MAG: hypothetical protein EOP51_05205 [Sphingobacteriales bacterium]|nr:MAG: hypothetical protein EOP51_05205 [Sphingobacteriales bacterium]
MKITKFGLSQIGNQTPLWAKWIFRIIFLLTTVTISWLAATNIVSDAQKYEITLFLKVVVDPIAYGLSKLFGIEETSLYNFQKGGK